MNTTIASNWQKTLATTNNFYLVQSVKSEEYMRVYITSVYICERKDLEGN